MNQVLYCSLGEDGSRNFRKCPVHIYVFVYIRKFAQDRSFNCRFGIDEL